MYPVAKGLPNNRILHVLGRAYAAPGEQPPAVLSVRGNAVVPVVLAAALVGLGEVLAMWI